MDLDSVISAGSRLTLSTSALFGSEYSVETGFNDVNCGFGSN